MRLKRVFLREKTKEEGKRREFMMLFQSMIYIYIYISIVEYRATIQRQTLFLLCQACLLVTYTVFCDEDSGGQPSSFQMDVLYHEFSESMFRRYIMRPHIVQFAYLSVLY